VTYTDRRKKTGCLIRPSLVRVLQPVAEAPDIEIERVESLPELDAARESMERATARR
jgi:hypothetical protein